MELDESYAIAAYTSGAEEFPPRWQAAAQAFRDMIGPRAELGVSYGPTDRQAIDIFHPEGPAKGTLVFVHGGYWKSRDRSEWSHLAAGALARGWNVAMPGYDLCPDVRISDITQQIARAMEKIDNRTFGPLVLAGHSAGGHLVGRMLDPLVLAEPVRARIERVAAISPLANLAPLLKTSMNEILQLDEAEAAAESLTSMAVPREAAVQVWVGADERPALLELAETLSRAWGAKQIVVPERHHFDVIEALEDAESDMVRWLAGLKQA